MLHNFHTTTVSLSDDKSQLSSRSLALRVFLKLIDSEFIEFAFDSIIDLGLFGFPKRNSILIWFEIDCMSTRVLMSTIFDSVFRIFSHNLSEIYIQIYGCCSCSPIFSFSIIYQKYMKYMNGTSYSAAGAAPHLSAYHIKLFTIIYQEP